MSELILVIDKEDTTTELLDDNSLFGSLNVFTAHNVPACLRTLYEERPQLVVMVLSDGHLGYVELCRLIRQMCDVPILCLTPPGCDKATIDCLEAGADDCATKDVSGPELNARVQALLRRCGTTAGSSGRRVYIGDMCIHTDAHRVTKRGVPVALTPREFSILCALAERPGCVVSHAELLSQIWGAEFVDYAHYLRLYIGYLRQKLEDDPGNPRYIFSEWGVGYRLGPVHMATSPERAPYSVPSRQLKRAGVSLRLATGT